jgi:hypothetical protein
MKIVSASAVMRGSRRRISSAGTRAPYTLGAMVATTHMLVAGALALKARSLKHGLTIGVLSHLMLDAVPHRDYRWGAFRGLALALDLTGGALAVGKLSGGSRIVLAGALGGVLPDIARPAERALNLKLTRPLHDTIHTASRPPAWSAVAVQGLTVASAGLLLRTATRGHRHVFAS